MNRYATATRIGICRRHIYWAYGIPAILKFTYQIAFLIVRFICRIIVTPLYAYIFIYRAEIFH